MIPWQLALLKYYEKMKMKEAKFLVVGYDNIPSINSILKQINYLLPIDQFPSLQAITKLLLNFYVEALDKSIKQEELPNILKQKQGVVLNNL